MTIWPEHKIRASTIARVDPLPCTQASPVQGSGQRTRDAPCQSVMPKNFMHITEKDITEFKAVLGDDADGITDEEIKKICICADELGDTLFDWWFETRNDILATDS